VIVGEGCVSFVLSPSPDYLQDLLFGEWHEPCQCSQGVRLFAALILLIFVSVGSAQDRDPDPSRIEITGSYWPVHTTGAIRANGTLIDLRSDLGVNQNTPTFTGKLDLRWSRRHRISVEGTPFRLEGDKSLSRSITYQGRVFSINDHISSRADLDYLYAGYQFDFISRPRGHFGLEAGGAFLSATGSITSQVTGVTASKSETVGMPLAGLAFRAFPVHKSLDVEINGELKGMDFGKYGHYVQASANVGIGRGHLLVEGGYRFVNADIHETSGVNAVTPEFRGPVISLVFRL
jgi:hypothetical protein